MTKGAVHVDPYISLGFRDRVRVSVLRLLYGLGIRLGLGFKLRFGSVLDYPPSYILYGFLCPLGLGIALGFRHRVRVSVTVSLAIGLGLR